MITPLSRKSIRRGKKGCNNFWDNSIVHQELPDQVRKLLARPRDHRAPRRPQKAPVDTPRGPKPPETPEETPSFDFGESTS